MVYLIRKKMTMEIMNKLKDHYGSFNQCDQTDPASFVEVLEMTDYTFDLMSRVFDEVPSYRAFERVMLKKVLPEKFSKGDLLHPSVAPRKLSVQETQLILAQIKALMSANKKMIDATLQELERRESIS